VKLGRVEKGAFISVEGSDGAGKTTQINHIEKRLQDSGIEVVRTREPGGTPLGERLRDLLLHSGDLPMSAETELLLVFAARRQHLDQLIWPALDAGKWVLSDRFTDATYAYQGAGRGIGADRIAQLEEWVQEGFAPDLTLVLDVAVDVGIQRSGGRSSEADRFERENLSFKEAVRRSYLERAARHPERIHVVDACGTVVSVQDRLSDLLDRFLVKRGVC
jgi:dTMP kinase